MSAVTGTAILGFRGVVLLQSLKVYLETNGRVRMTRIATPGNMRKIATEFTGREYKASRKGLELAYADMQAVAAGKNLAELGDVRVVNSEVGGLASDLEDSK